MTAQGDTNTRYRHDVVWLFAILVVVVSLLMGSWPLIVLPFVGAIIIYLWVLATASVDGEG